MRSRVITLCVVLALALFVHPRVHADGVADEAEVNFRLGTERYQAGDYRGALAHFLASNRLAPNRHVRFNIARTFQRLGQYPEAYRWCTEALRTETDPALRAQLEDALRTIEREVAVLAVETSPSGATVYLDRIDLGSVATTPATLALPEGEHRVIVQLEGYHEDVSEPFVAVRGHSVKLAFALERIVGTVEVGAEATTEVRVGDERGELACTTPCRLELAPGFHQLHFRRDGFRVRSQQVRVAARELTRVRAEAVALTGSLLVTADEPGVEVEVDGLPVGFTPLVVRNVAVGTRKVRLEARGFQPVERTVSIREGEQTELRDLSLTPSREVTAASRVRQSIDEAPASVTIIGSQELEAFRYPTIYEALRGQRGVTLTDDAAYAGVSLRGLGQPGDYGNRVLVLSDGATLNDNILWQSYVGFDGRVTLDDVERIELVRGAGSVLYGTGAVTGVINLIPREPPSEPFVEARVSALDPRTARARVSSGVPLGAHGGLTLSGAGAHGQGERVMLPSPVSASVDDVRSFDAATGEARLHYRDLRMQAFVTTRRQHVPQGAYGGIVGHPQNDLSDTRGLFEARYEPSLSEQVQLFVRAFGNFYRFSAEQAFPGEDASEVAIIDERYHGVWYGSEARVIVEPLPGMRLTGGAELQVNTAASLRGSATEAGVGENYLSADEPYRTYAGYALIEGEVTRWLTASAGARVDAWSTFGVTVNPRAALVFRPTERDVLKLMVGRAFRAPSIYELRYGDGGVTQVPSDYRGNELVPELVWSGELEYTHRFAEGWSALGSVHAQHAENFIFQRLVTPSDDASPVYYDNGGAVVRTLGADVELKREFRAGWMFAASYAFLEARYASAAAGGGSTRVPNVPRHFASVRGILPLFASLRLAARASLEAPRRISTDTRAETDTSVIADLVLSGEVARAGIDYALGLYNVFDYRLLLPTDPTFSTPTMPQPGRTLLVSLGLRL